MISSRSVWVSCLLGAFALIGCENKPTKMDTPAADTSLTKPTAKVGEGSNPQSKKKIPTAPPAPPQMKNP